MNDIHLDKLKEESIKILKSKFWKNSIIEFSPLTLKSWMKARNKDIPDLLISNSISIKKDETTQSNFSLFIGRWENYKEVEDDYLKAIKNL